MTPPTRKTRIHAFPLSLLTAPLLAFGLLCPPAQATVAPHALASLQGLRVAGEPTVPTLRDMVVQAGLNAIGTPYTWGGDDPEDGFDCSGLVLFVYREIAGMDLPRTARAQRKQGHSVARSQLQPGDLVFFTTRGRSKAVSHVGIYIGQNEFVHAPSRGASVRVDRLDSSYWGKRYAGARRYIDVPGAKRLVAQADNRVR